VGDAWQQCAGSGGGARAAAAVGCSR
jgi:hypothetical protein